MADLVWVIKNGDMDKVQETVEKENIDINTEINGRYPLHYAADYGQYKVMEYLISKGAKLDITDKYGISPILAAIWEGHTKCVELLLTKGASKSGTTPDGKTYLEAAEKDEIRGLLS